MGRNVGTDREYVVLDFETTGLNPRLDRVIEVGAVLLNSNFEEIESFETLVKVERDLGPVSIHGIRSVQLRDAPSFADLAPVLLGLLSGRVLVAHNAEFDLQFLVSELNRLDLAVEKSDFGVFCTRTNASRFVASRNSKLSTLATQFGIRVANAHHAIDDARVTGQVLKQFHELAPDEFASLETTVLFLDALPSNPVFRAVNRVDASTDSDLSFVQRLIVSTAAFQGSGEENDYSESLEQAFLDAHLTEQEARNLVELASKSGLSHQQISEIHKALFNSWVDAAWADGTLTSSEKSDIRYIGSVLGVSEIEVERSLISRPAEFSNSRISTFSLNPGDLVVLTGDMTPTKSEMTTFLTTNGLVVGDSVTKRTKLLVAADPESHSGKAKKARSYGIRVCDTHWVISALSGNGN